MIYIFDYRQFWSEVSWLSPCEIAQTLEETGVDFTAHVVGFDVAD